MFSLIVIRVLLVPFAPDYWSYVHGVTVYKDDAELHMSTLHDILLLVFIVITFM